MVRYIASKVSEENVKDDPWEVNGRESEYRCKKKKKKKRKRKKERKKESKKKRKENGKERITPNNSVLKEYPQTH